MTQGTKDAILTIYDEGISKNKAIQTICKMYAFSRAEVIEVLKEGGRKLPYERKQVEQQKEPTEIKEVVEEAQQAAADRGLPVSNYIYEVLADKMDELELRIRELDMEREFYIARFKTISMFIKDNNL